MKNSVDVILGNRDDLAQLFPCPSTSIAITDQVALAFNQTLQRDMFFGAWSDVYYHQADGMYHVRLTSPDKDLSRYEKTIPAYMQACRKAKAIFDDVCQGSSGVQFMMPFGLAMSDYKSVQLLHYPPTEAFTFLDYIYTPTNRRWESLLASNGFNGTQNTLLERMVDLVPLAAPGDNAQDVTPHNDQFYDYVVLQLVNFLGANAKGKRTAPVAAGGAPVRDMVGDVYGEQIRGKLEVLSVIELEIVRGKKTPLICTNHPSQYLFFLGDNGVIPKKNEEQAVTVMRQDLIAAGWQAEMANNWKSDPKKVLSDMKKKWRSQKKVKEVMKIQNLEFAYYD